MILISYYRVSTDKQGRSKLGLDAQKQIVASFVATRGGTVVAEYTEVETGKRSDRPELAKALAHCHRIGATLVIAKLDRLARDVHFITGLQKADIPLLFCDFPDVPSNAVGTMFVQLMAVFAEFEANLISERTKVALAAAKARGVKLGAARPGAFRLQGGQPSPKAAQRAGEESRRLANKHYATIAPTITKLRQDGLSLRQIVTHLNNSGSTTRTGKPWNPAQVARVLQRTA